MQQEYSVCNLMPKPDYSKMLSEIQKTMEKKTLTDQQKYIMIKEIVSRPMLGDPLRLL